MYIGYVHLKKMWGAIISDVHTQTLKQTTWPSLIAPPRLLYSQYSTVPRVNFSHWHVFVYKIQSKVFKLGGGVSPRGTAAGATAAPPAPDRQCVRAPRRPAPDRTNHALLLGGVGMHRLCIRVLYTGTKNALLWCLVPHLYATDWWLKM